MFEIANAKVIIQNAPKYSKIIEPFGANGSLAFILSKKKPKEHILNVFDDVKFALFNFLQNLSSSDKSILKAKDWIASEETFDAVSKINAVDGVDFFYKWMYQKNFGVFDMKDMTIPPVYDWVVEGKDIKYKTYELPILKIALKGVTILNEEPISVINKAYGSDSYLILTPKGSEDTASVDAKLNSIKSPFIYIKKIKTNDEYIEEVNGTKNKVTAIFPGSVMPGRAALITNYENKLKPVIDGELNK